MAHEQGNAVRSMALMRMAHRDGDQRATEYLAQHDYPVNSIAANSSQDNSALISLSQGDLK